MSAGRIGWTLVGIVCVSCIGASLSNSKEAPPEPPGQVGRFVPIPNSGLMAMDTTNGQMWKPDGKGWAKMGNPILGQNAEANQQASRPDPTGKLRPKPEEDFNTVDQLKER